MQCTLSTIIIITTTSTTGELCYLYFFQMSSEKIGSGRIKHKAVVLLLHVYLLLFLFTTHHISENFIYTATFSKKNITIFSTDLHSLPLLRITLDYKCVRGEFTRKSEWTHTQHCTHSSSSMTWSFTVKKYMHIYMMLKATGLNVLLHPDFFHIYYYNF